MLERRLYRALLRGEKQSGDNLSRTAKALSGCSGINNSASERDLLASRSEQAMDREDAQTSNRNLNLIGNEWYSKIVKISGRGGGICLIVTLQNIKLLIYKEIGH